MVENLLGGGIKRLPPFAEKTPPGAVYGTRVVLRPCATTDCRWMHGLRQIVRFGDLIAYLREGAKANKAIYRHCTRSRPATTHVKKKKKRTEEKKRTNPFGVVDPARAFIPFVILSDEKLPEIRAYTRKRWFWNLFYKLLFYFCTRVSANRDLPNRGGSTVRFSEPNSANVGKTRNGEFDSWYA